MKYEHLFEPIVLGKRLYKNRIFYSPTGYKEQPVDEAACFYERKAMGGAASVCVGDSAVAPDGIARSNQLRTDLRATVPAFEQITAAISRHGAVPALEILHAGTFAHYSAELGGKLLGPVAGETPDGFEIHAMTEEMILKNINDYAAAAANAEMGGFERIVLHAGHGWQLFQFLSPTMNTRTDMWGGPSIENRARFTVAVCDAIKKKCPNLTLEVRISGSECFDGGYGVDEGVEIAKQLDGHCDMIHVSAGNHEVVDGFLRMSPSMFHPDGVNVQFAEEIKKHVNTPVATVGALSDPELLEEIIATGKADVVEIARGLIADPDIPIKAMMGREDEINKCMRCAHCYSHHMHRSNYRCAINPIVGNEHELKHDFKPAVLKKVLVVGGGIAGMKAALTAAERGHTVTLCEKTDRLGGGILCEDEVPFKFGVKRYIELQKRLLSRSNVKVEMNTEVTKELAEKYAPDVIIAANGSKPIVPAFIPGYDRANVYSAEYIYTHLNEAGENMVIIGGGLVGLELAAYSAMNGKKVTVLEMLPRLGVGQNNLQGLALSQEFAKYGVKVSTCTRVTEINEKGVVAVNTGDTAESSDMPFGHPAYPSLAEKEGTLFPADTVVYAVGYKSNHQDAFALKGVAKEFYMIGDVNMPRNIQKATSEAFFTARDLGRYY